MPSLASSAFLAALTTPTPGNTQAATPAASSASQQAGSVSQFGANTSTSAFVGQTSPNGNANANGNSQGNDNGNGRALGLNANTTGLSAQAGANGKGKALGQANKQDAPQADESSVITQTVQARNGVIADAIASQTTPAISGTATPSMPGTGTISAVTTAGLSDLSSSALSTAAPTPVPEPANWLLLALGLLLLGARAVMRRGLR